jgi:hypothetical protein
VEAQSVERGEPNAPALTLTVQYQPGNRVIEIRFTQELDRFRTVKIELLEGIVSADGLPLKPSTLTFTLGG